MVQISTRLYWIFQSLIAFIPYLLAGTLVLALGVFIARFLARAPQLLVLFFNYA